jgi:hypothetical protein
MPKGWVGQVARGWRDDLIAELQERRDKGRLTVSDHALVDACFWAVCGLVLGYGHLAEFGWINNREHAFFPIVESCARLHKCLQDSLAKLGLDRPAPLDPWQAIYGPQSDAVGAAQAQSAVSGDGEGVVDAGDVPAGGAG